MSLAASRWLSLTVTFKECKPAQFGLGHCKKITFYMLCLKFVKKIPHFECGQTIKDHIFSLGFHCAFQGFLNKAGAPTITFRFPIGLYQHIKVTNCKYSTPFLLYPSNSKLRIKTAFPSQKRKLFERKNNLVRLYNFASPKTKK